MKYDDWLADDDHEPDCDHAVRNKQVLRLVLL
jgi:hypothetical protein